MGRGYRAITLEKYLFSTGLGYHRSSCTFFTENGVVRSATGVGGDNKYFYEASFRRIKKLLKMYSRLQAHQSSRCLQKLFAYSP